MSEPTEPHPPELLPDYLAEGLQKQDAETLRAVTQYAQDLRVFRTAQTVADRTDIASIPHSKRATSDELAATARTNGISDDIADWEAICEKGVPTKASIVTKTINDNQYHYFQWREGERIKSEYIGPASQ